MEFARSNLSKTQRHEPGQLKSNFLLVYVRLFTLNRLTLSFTFNAIVRYEI